MGRRTRRTGRSSRTQIIDRGHRGGLDVRPHRRPPAPRPPQRRRRSLVQQARSGLAPAVAVVRTRTGAARPTWAGCTAGRPSWCCRSSRRSAIAAVTYLLMRCRASTPRSVVIGRAWPPRSPSASACGDRRRGARTFLRPSREGPATAERHLFRKDLGARAPGLGPRPGDPAAVGSALVTAHPRLGGGPPCRWPSSPSGSSRARPRRRGDRRLGTSRAAWSSAGGPARRSSWSRSGRCRTTCTTARVRRSCCGRSPRCSSTDGSGVVPFIIRHSSGRDLHQRRLARWSSPSTSASSGISCDAPEPGLDASGHSRRSDLPLDARARVRLGCWPPMGRRRSGPSGESRAPSGRTDRPSSPRQARPASAVRSVVAGTSGERSWNDGSGSDRHHPTSCDRRWAPP